MKKYLITLLCVGVGFMAAAQERIVPITKILQKNINDVEKLSWSEWLNNDEDIYKLSFGEIRRKTRAPFRGEMSVERDGCIIKGSGSISDVISFAKGVVIRSYADSIVIDHGNGLVSTYKNIVSKKVGIGSRVKRGDLIGRLSQDDKYLYFELRLGGVPVKLTEIFDPKTSLITYAGYLYVYNIDKNRFVSRISPMVILLFSDDYIDGVFTDHYDRFIAEHREKRDVVDSVVDNAIEDEISLEEVQVEAAEKPEAIRVKNEIDL